MSVDTESITFNESNKSASVTLVNQERAEDEDEETEEEEKKCAQICEELGVTYRIRPWED